jgi:SAM-dependent methyltransferase
VEERAEGAGGEFNYSGEELDALAGARNYYGWISASFAPWLGRRMLEAGAGIGTFTDWLLARRPDAHVTAVEPAANNFPTLSRRWAGDPRVTAVQGYLDDSLPAASADTVVAVNVMEHVEDDAAFLRAAARVLAPGGHLCLFVPALPALYGSLDEAFEHHRRYTRRGLEGRLRGAGLELVRVRYMNMPGMVAWWLFSKVLRRRTITARDAGVYDRWVVPLVRAVEDRIPPPVGNGLLAVARKN